MLDWELKDDLCVWLAEGVRVDGLGYSLIATIVISYSLARKYASDSVLGLNIRTDICRASVNPAKKNLKA